MVFYSRFSVKKVFFVFLRYCEITVLKKAEFTPPIKNNIMKKDFN